MNYYREQLNKFHKTGLCLTDILCAEEVDCIFKGNDIKIAADIFEDITDFVCTLVAKEDVAVHVVARALVELLRAGVVDITDFREPEDLRKVEKLVKAKI